MTQTTDTLIERLEETCRLVEWDMLNRPAPGDAFVAHRNDVAAIISALRSTAKDVEACREALAYFAGLGMDPGMRDDLTPDDLMGWYETYLIPAGRIQFARAALTPADPA